MCQPHQMVGLNRPLLVSLRALSGSYSCEFSKARVVVTPRVRMRKQVNVWLQDGANASFKFIEPLVFIIRDSLKFARDGTVNLTSRIKTNHQLRLEQSTLVNA